MTKLLLTSVARTSSLMLSVMTALISHPSISHAATLLVDFSPSTANVASGYAGFIFNNNTVPGTRTYLSGSTGYSGSMDTGSGIGVTLADPNNSSQVFRMIDRGGADLLLRDFVGRDTSFNQLQELRFSGLVAGSYSLTVPLTDTNNQTGVVDVQLSVNGGTFFSNIFDNLAYGLNVGRTAQLNFNANGLNNVIVRFSVGGNLFGTTGGTTNGVSLNRIFTINGLQLTTVPEPSNQSAILALLGLGGVLLFKRHPHKV